MSAADCGSNSSAIGGFAAKPAAAMQYGAAIHRVLKTYFDSVELERPKTDDELIDHFRSYLAEAKIHEAYQHELTRIRASSSCATSS